MKRSAFTLIEILVVIAVLGILATVAIGNLLEAQVRAKVVRAQADMAAIAIGLEVYAVDANDYPPNDGRYNVTPIVLTTPISYMSNQTVNDPFAEKIEHPFWGREARKYTYGRVVLYPWLEPPPPIEGVDHPSFNPGARRKYGEWYQLSIGPDLLYSGKDRGLGTWPTFLFDLPYDSSNGTVSFGNIMRTQRQTLVEETPIE